MRPHVAYFVVYVLIYFVYFFFSFYSLSLWSGKHRFIRITNANILFEFNFIHGVNVSITHLIQRIRTWKKHNITHPMIQAKLF